MIVGIFCFHHIPYAVMRVVCLVSALVKVSTADRADALKVLEQKAVRNIILDTPEAVFDIAFHAKNASVLGKMHPAVSVFAQADVHNSLGIDFKVNVIYIVYIGFKKELHAAVTAYFTVFLGNFCTQIFFIGLKTYAYAFTVTQQPKPGVGRSKTGQTRPGFFTDITDLCFVPCAVIKRGSNNIGLFDLNLVSTGFAGARTVGAIIVYTIIAIAALWLILSPFITDGVLWLKSRRAAD